MVDENIGAEEAKTAPKPEAWEGPPTVEQFNLFLSPALDQEDATTWLKQVRDHQGYLERLEYSEDEGMHSLTRPADAENEEMSINVVGGERAVFQWGPTQFDFDAATEVLGALIAPGTEGYAPVQLSRFDYGRYWNFGITGNIYDLIRVVMYNERLGSVAEELSDELDHPAKLIDLSPTANWSLGPERQLAFSLMGGTPRSEIEESDYQEHDLTVWGGVLLEDVSELADDELVDSMIRHRSESITILERSIKESFVNTIVELGSETAEED